ncbi:ORF6N domain-containing protein [Butyrivibrio sp. AE2032]|uniref:ORF6N domain-containing protein n=1 Tax=Butyrivibrio sp. AE2032 TaxID=1458463 RepID=UPI0005537E77|nr:ORF6N domain-containing protein [Butyrivibrio sp. AE2032]
MTKKNEILLLDDRDLEEKVYIVRGVQVMLDFELAEIYGYTTSKLNEQVKNNKERFVGEEFMFQLTAEEFRNLKSKNRIASWGGRRIPPHAFTEQGVYLLMTVLKGELAVEQSRKLVWLFKKMKDHIIENKTMISGQNLLTIAAMTEEHSQAIKRIESEMVRKSDLSDFMKLFNNDLKDEEVLILDGEPFKADVAYQKIYSKAKKSIIVIDDYIGVKTLRHLASSKSNVLITIISDNKGGAPLRVSEYNDFMTEYAGRTIDFIKTNNRAHDRYIIIDNATNNMKLYHCGASSKDAGKRITTISRIMEVDVYKSSIQQLLANPVLILK